MRAVSIVLAAAVLVGGCAVASTPGTVPAHATGTTPAAQDAPALAELLRQLDGSHWRFVRVAGEPVPDTVTATMRFANGHASGKAGCNAYGASYAIQPDGSAHFQQGMSTKMACLQPAGAMQVEHGVFAAFRQATKVEPRGGDLVLLDAAGRPLATLARLPALRQ